MHTHPLKKVIGNCKVEMGEGLKSKESIKLNWNFQNGEVGGCQPYAPTGTQRLDDDDEVGGWSWVKVEIKTPA